MRPLQRLLTPLAWTALALAGVALAVLLLARQALQPAPGAWATTVRLGPLSLQADVPSLIWLGTTPWIAALMDGRSVPSPAGTLHLSWQTQQQTLVLDCRPCSVPVQSIGDQALRLDQARLTVRRQGAQLHGTLASGSVRATWQGTLSPHGLRLQAELPETPIRDGYALFADTIPELAHARIDGVFSARLSLSLPDGALSITPQVTAFAVQGLGTQAFLGARSACQTHPRKSRLGADSLLARAVIAAEDQRFYKHTGFDLAELGTSLQQNQRAGHIERGASTLSQQLARLLVTGGARTPTRKLRELLYAVELEQTLGKARILRLYLELAPWGNGLCGAEAAARHYFARRAQDLDAAQAVWLAAMLHQPSAEAQRWRRTGHINVARAQWVAANLRPMPRTQREALADGLSKVSWDVPAAQAAAQLAAKQ